ncbi:PucR family transcriptional regulator [Pseudonocardia endophytica]|uniref:DNA-binding PucR family transcriptional regulator n=1 Tax=Pseudonocardia endophytica TaxID=401976 RepID=A0A4R1I1X4_PSEEN|nr:PucR family transcriptional regulator [Pseudonocardia endophytica]TCK27585.1 DNA-binding PucR family transcriptional regulator [Pseudonocardia endophytica]
MAESTPIRHREATELLVAAVQERMPALLDAVVTRIRAEIPLYQRDDIVTVDELRASVAHNVEFIVAGLVGGTGQPDLNPPRTTGRARAAQGAPLVEMLTAYRVGFAETWTRMIATARTVADIPDDALVDLAGTVFGLQNAYCDAATDAYRDEAHHLARTRERERAVLVEAVLAGTSAQGTLWEVAQALRLPLDGAFLVVVARAELGHDPMPRIEPALAVLDVSSVWRLETEYFLGLVSLGKRSRATSVLGSLGTHATGLVGVSPVFAELRQAGWALRLARLALDSHPGTIGVEQFRDRPLNVLLAAAPHAALDTAREVLSNLLTLPADDRETLLRTFDVWVDCGGSAPEAGAALYCHPNTVRYRLRRIETSTGRSLSAPADVAELVASIRAWNQLPHSNA